MQKRWQILAENPEAQETFAKQLNISPIIAAVFIKKGFSLDQARTFLNSRREPFHDAFLLPDMQQGTDRIQLALKNNDHIMIFGDYDVDGITATTVLYKTLKKLNANVSYYLPDRQTEGYGVHKEAIDKFIDKVQLLITVDCGIRSVEELEYASQYMDVIVTDHHLPGEILPKAIAVIDPKRSDNKYPDTNLAGVGVAFKLCQALWQSIHHEIYREYLDIVSLGTVADIVPLLGENRKFVQEGLANITNIGLLELINVCNLDKDNISAGHIGFIIGPRLNAAGRLKHARLGVELFLANNKNQAHALAITLDEENQLRQDMVEATFNEAISIIEKQHYHDDAAIVVGGTNWHPGIIGIVASRIVDKYYRPTIVLSIDSDIAKGSCRSIKNFDICAALENCRENLLAFGGHTMAAGLSLKPSAIDDFRKLFNNYAKKNLQPEDLQPLIEITKVISPNMITKKLIDDIAVLEPFGMGNPAPLFLCTSVIPQSVKQIGRNEEHLKFIFNDKQKNYTVLAWNMAEYAAVIANKKMDLVFQPEINLWNDKEYIQLIVKDIKTTPLTSLYPEHDTIGSFYLFLKKFLLANNNIISANIEHLQKIYQHETSSPTIDISLIQYCLQVLTEIGVIVFDTANNTISLPLQLNGKKSLYSSPTFIKRYK
ncbi:single-stranded-DNA-specific exonuclease RecJ [Pectinatus brassicae]|uniref:Single-stranded-DNA-specific exonuclease RecJ n=1 Tax=Pectinatus brassicae TaxID=862415 RepID=A0A840UGX4_9FIRM|nr:single-stranded-DNA-specific exonuclease RecJ [Pectinatus brassicae]MBB5335440.1 single-stranded-DNA-specific exonuclease [Pectinatus brassicae]